MKPYIIANYSGFWGDRADAAKEQVQGGRIDVLCGDYLAELTMVILQRQFIKNNKHGYCRSVVRHAEDVLGTCLEKNIKLVVNAGGVNPAACSDAILQAAQTLGLEPKIATVAGDNLTAQFLAGEFAQAGHFETNELVSSIQDPLLCAHAYLGARGIASAVDAGADIVLTGRVVDAAVLLGPAAAHFGWQWDDWDRLAAGIVAGHLLECGPQVTGGNYSNLDEIPEFRKMGYPIAEMYEDGSFVVTKHPDTGGIVSCGTVIAQSLYEIAGPEYPTPDVIARFDSFNVEQIGENRVKVSGVCGSEPSSTLKVSLHTNAGFRNAVTIVVSPGEIDRKLDIIRTLFWEEVGGQNQFDQCHEDVFYHSADGGALIRFAVRGRVQDVVGRTFSDAAVALSLASIPGMTMLSPPSGANPCIATWPVLVDKTNIDTVVCHHDGESQRIAFEEPVSPDRLETDRVEVPEIPDSDFKPTKQVRLGEIVGARSGDKGDHANIGLWIIDPEKYELFKSWMSPERLRLLLPRDFKGEILRYEFSNMLALNFLLKGFLSPGGFANIYIDNQGKLLGEQIRSKMVDAPVELLL